MRGYECRNCGGILIQGLDDGGTYWMHTDGYVECALVNRASPNFDKPMDTA